MRQKKGLPKDDLHKTPKNQLKTITTKTPVKRRPTFLRVTKPHSFDIIKIVKYKGLITWEMSEFKNCKQNSAHLIFSTFFEQEKEKMISLSYPDLASKSRIRLEGHPSDGVGLSQRFLAMDTSTLTVRQKKRPPEGRPA